MVFLCISLTFTCKAFKNPDFENKSPAKKSDFPNRPLNIFHMAKIQCVMVSCLSRSLKNLKFCIFLVPIFGLPPFSQTQGTGFSRRITVDVERSPTPTRKRKAAAVTPPRQPKRRHTGHP